MPEAQSYSGSCHCGAIAYTVEVDTAQALKCNCSICTKLGAVWAFAPKSKFKLSKGADKQGDYLFNKKRLHHHFCTTCGIAPFTEGVDPKGNRMVAINVRCVEGIDPRGLEIKFFNGRDL